MITIDLSMIKIKSLKECFDALDEKIKKSTEFFELPECQTLLKEINEVMENHFLCYDTFVGFKNNATKETMQKKEEIEKIFGKKVPYQCSDIIRHLIGIHSFIVNNLENLLIFEFSA